MNHQTSNSEIARSRASDYLNKVGDVHQGRMTWHLAFLVAAVTVTGFAYETSRKEAFLLAAGILLIAYLTDLFFKRFVVMPLVYKALMTELELEEREPISLLMLDWDKGDDSKYATLKDIKSPDERRRQFRKWYIRRDLVRKTILFGILITTELALYWW